MTQTDIPPGGEGKIEVTFDSSHKKGKQSKTITVESNDPAHPKETLRISLLIEVEFEFESSSLIMGRIRKGEAASKTAVLLIKDASKRNLITLNSQSAHVVASMINSPGGVEGRIEIAVTVTPETPPGKLNEWVIAELSDGSLPGARLQISGTVIGNVEVTPETVRFKIDTSRAATAQAEQEIQVKGSQSDSKFRLLGVEDSKSLLAIGIDTVAAEGRYVIRAKPNANALTLGHNASGELRILTDDSEQPVISVSYGIIIAR